MKNPRKVIEYWPISLCTVLYTIISKTMVNRMKQFMPLLISKYQSAFVPSKLITDNILVPLLKKMILKLNMAKAYDRVKWYFLEAMMRKLGFNNRGLTLIMDFITSVTYSVHVRGSSVGLITLSRGLRQGDPLSPYLFLICAEGLSALLRQAQRKNLIHGVAVVRGAPSISHLLFADDSLLFCHAHLLDCQNLLNIIRLYQRGSGQKVNFEKSAACFSPENR